VVGLVTCCLIFSSPFRQAVIETPAPKKNSDSFTIALLLPGLLYMWLGYRILKRRIPKGFDIFNEEL
jgi:hypothetical protein